MLKTTRVSLLLLALLLALTGCVETVKGTAHPALRDHGSISRLAVAPFSLSERLVGVKTGELETSVAAELLANRFAEAIAARGVHVIPPSDVAIALEAAGITGRRVLARQVATVVAEKFGADAVLVGRLTRLVARDGSAAGANRAATVGFVVDLHGAPGAARLWTGNFDETQRPLTDNVFDASRYPGGGSRWLSAEELLSWGALEVSNAMPVGY
ncbi:MAG: hypothetical protein JRH01_20140 [Deltaproteobacteria bacterium]|nr:hypothetical protein [Deltaproteobacteria bacterium]